MSSSRHVFFLPLVVCLLLFASRAQASDLRKAVLIPQWEPQAQFAGYYVAKARGFYEKRGVDMEILRGGPGSPPSKLLAEGRAQFGTMFLSSAVRARSAGLPLRNLVQFMRGGTLMLVARKAGGIVRPEDLNGKRVSMWGDEFSIQQESFFKKHGVYVTRLPQGPTVDLFLRGGVDAVSAMYYNEYHMLLNGGLDEEDMTVFSMRDHGLDPPEDGLYCLDSTFNADPDLCRAVAEASLEGWLYAFEHPEEALDMVMERVEAANRATNRMHQKWMLARIREAMQPGGGMPGPGELSRKEFDSAAEALESAGLMHKPVKYEEFHVQAR